ncbi:MAG: carboxypeptidase-like regulatory domain-containing protein, partial [Tannerella sp.]|nr:carboxypeptidase-like regulatory domain-containing protein [Tannerella sp.]
MKLFTILVLLAIFCASASVTYSQEVKITLNLSNATVGKALDEIKKQSEFSFWYRSEEIDLNQTVSVSVRKQSIENVLTQLLSEQNLSYKIDEKHIIIYKKTGELLTSQERQQSLRITGTVTDADGEALPGATVVEKGTTNGTAADADGKFSLTVSGNATLQVAFVGYITQEIKATDKPLVIKLIENTQALEEVVIVGYGTQKKVSLTGAVATLKPAEIQNVPTGNLTNALAGRISGVTIQSNDGGIPGESASFQIRGRSTWHTGTDQSKNEPLFVIDGVVRDKFAFDGLNANEIDQLSVLKDASAAAVYGARAANGVVLVTTKRGKSGKPMISYAGSVGYNTPTMIPVRETAYEHTLATNSYNMEH